MRRQASIGNYNRAEHGSFFRLAWILIELSAWKGSKTHIASKKNDYVGMLLHFSFNAETNLDTKKFLPTRLIFNSPESKKHLISTGIYKTKMCEWYGFW